MNDKKANRTHLTLGWPARLLRRRGGGRGTAVSAAAADRAAARGRRGRIVAIDGGGRRHGVVVVTIFVRFVFPRYLRKPCKSDAARLFSQPHNGVGTSK